MEFQDILEIIKGSLIANLYIIYGFWEWYYKKRIKGTRFILDTRVLIDVLGLNLQQECNAAQELLELIINHGGKVVTFDYYVEELRGIIHRFEKSPETRLELSLNCFVRNGYSSQDVYAYAETIEDRLQECGVTIIQKPDYEKI